MCTAESVNQKLGQLFPALVNFIEDLPRFRPCRVYVNWQMHLKDLVNGNKLFTCWKRLRNWLNKTISKYRSFSGRPTSGQNGTTRFNLQIRLINMKGKESNTQINIYYDVKNVKDQKFERPGSREVKLLQQSPHAYMYIYKHPWHERQKYAGHVVLVRYCRRACGWQVQ